MGFRDLGFRVWGLGFRGSRLLQDLPGHSLIKTSQLIWNTVSPPPPSSPSPQAPTLPTKKYPTTCWACCCAPLLLPGVRQLESNLPAAGLPNVFGCIGHTVQDCTLLLAAATRTASCKPMMQNSCPLHDWGVESCIGPNMEHGLRCSSKPQARLVWQLVLFA